MSKNTCKATTKSGNPCKNKAYSNGYCHIHNPKRLSQKKVSQNPKQYSFSQRQGITPVNQAIQIKSINQDLRNSLWNVLSKELFFDYSYSLGFMLGDIREGDAGQLIIEIWSDFFKLSLDSLPDNKSDAVKKISDFFQRAHWYQVYDFIEFVVNSVNWLALDGHFNTILIRESAGYRFIDGVLTDIVDPKEIKELEYAIKDNKFPGSGKHLKRALELMSDRENPDYRNSIKESISAIESIAKEITGKPKATLGEAFKNKPLSEKIHPALRQSFLSLYGYTSDEGGIRHAMLDEPHLDADDARFFLLSCTSFIN